MVIFERKNPVKNFWPIQYIFIWGCFLMSCDDDTWTCTDSHEECSENTDHPTPQSTPKDKPQSQPAFSPPAPINEDASDENFSHDAEATSNSHFSLQLSCGENSQHHIGFTLQNTSTFQATASAQWANRAGACASYIIRRSDGHAYLFVIIPGQNIHSIDQWILEAPVGNNTPPHEIMNPREGVYAYLYTSTDLGFSKISALYFTESVVLYIEWLATETRDAEDRLREIQASGLVLDIPEDLRNLILELQNAP